MTVAILEDGYQTLITFSLNGAIKFYEKTVTPPGMDGGGEIDVTTMRNTLYRTRAPKALITVSPSSASVAYDPAVYNDIIAMLNKNQQITVTFKDGSTIQFWGYLDKFTPGENQEGTMPLANIETIPTNRDNSKVEQAPVYTAG